MRKFTIIKLIFLLLVAMRVSPSYAEGHDDELKKWLDTEYFTLEYMLVKPEYQKINTENDIIDLLSKKLKDKSRLKYLKSDNTALIRLFYEEAIGLEERLDNIVVRFSLKREDSSVTDLIFAERNRIKTLKNEFYSSSWNIEKVRFEKLVSAKFYSIRDDDNDTLASLLSKPGWNPEKGYLYGLEYMQVFQAAKGGYLMRQHPFLTVGTPRIAFLFTSKSFVDEDNLGGGYAEYVGVYKYQSILGVKTVHSFRLRDLGDGQLIKGKRFYFYPHILDITNIQKEITKDAFGI